MVPTESRVLMLDLLYLLEEHQIGGRYSLRRSPTVVTATSKNVISVRVARLCRRIEPFYQRYRSLD